MNDKSLSDVIFIENMEFFGYHGVLDFEKEVGQVFVVSVRLSASTHLSGITDDLNDSTNYGDVFNTIKHITEDLRFNLLEALAGTIATTILELYPLISGLTVRVNKPHAPISGIFGAVGVEITRERK